MTSGSETRCSPLWFEASDGYRISYRRWDSQRPRRGCVVALHGIQSHSGWYEYSSNRLANAGYDVFFPDRRGSGQNSTERGHAEHADRLISDVVTLLRLTRHETGMRPTLLGLSWGGKLATAVAACRPELLSNLVLLYPGLRARIQPNRLQRLLLNLAMRTGKGRRRVPIPLRDPTLFAGDPQWQEFIRRDHLALHHVSVAFLQASLSLDRIVESHPERIVSPLLVMLAGRDRVTDNQATRELIRHFATLDRTIIEYTDACHTLEFEPNRDVISDELIRWLDNRTP